MVQHHAISDLSDLPFQLDYQGNDKLVVSVVVNSLDLDIANISSLFLFLC